MSPAVMLIPPKRMDEVLKPIKESRRPQFNPNIPPTENIALYTPITRSALPSFRTANVPPADEKKKKGKTKTEKPEIHKVSIWLDDHLFKQIDDFTIRVTTHKGYTFIP
ncbi:MAG: hypothetical protein JZD40_04080, partial [Sulfolobus sp.]|nr:hypothetical protein [Sulfolobus sp.]